MVLFYNIGYILLSLLGITRSPETSFTEDNPSQYKVVCILKGVTGLGPVSQVDFDPFLCTHAIYVFPTTFENQIAPSNIYQSLKVNGERSFEQFKSLKQKNPNLKSLFSIKDPTNSGIYTDPEARAGIINGLIILLLNFQFDGLDIYWAKKDDDAQHYKQNFVTLLKEFREGLDRHGFLLSATLSANKNDIDTAYDIPEISKYVDFINVKAYDFHGYWENTTGHLAPLYSGSDGSESDKISTVDYAIKYWIKNGAPRSKINLGMALYGRSFTLANAANNGLGAATTGPGHKGPISEESGLLGYNEICSDKGWTEVFEETIKAPYAYKGNQWVGYENVKSIDIKVDYLMQEGLGGGMVWLLDDDDFEGSCGGGKFPLLTTVATKLKEEKPTPEPKPETTTQPITVPTTTEPEHEFRCTKEGYFRDPFDCSVYYYCKSLGRNEFHKNTLNCPAGLAYDETLHVCNWRNNVPGCE